MRLVARWSDGPETTPSLPPLGVTSARRLFRALACEEPEARRLWPERLSPVIAERRAAIAAVLAHERDMRGATTLDHEARPRRFMTLGWNDEEAEKAARLATNLLSEGPRRLEMACRVETRLVPRQPPQKRAAHGAGPAVLRVIWGANGLAAASGLACASRDQRDFLIDLGAGAITSHPFRRRSA